MKIKKIVVLVVIVVLILLFVGIKVSFSNVNDNKCDTSSKNQEILELGNNITNLNNQIEDLEKQVKDLNTTIKTLNINIDSLNENNTNLDKKIKTLTEEKNNLKANNSTLTNQINALTKEKEEILASKLSLEEQKENLQNQVEDLTTQINNLSSQIDNLKSQIETLRNTFTVFYSISGKTVANETVKKGETLKNKPTQGPDGQTIVWDENITTVSSDTVIQGTYYCTLKFESELDDMQPIMHFDTDNVTVPCGSTVVIDDNLTTIYSSENESISVVTYGDLTSNYNYKVNNEELGSNSFFTLTKPTTIVGTYGACVVEGTKITLSNGLTKNIEDLKIGEEILSYNRFDGKLAKEKITSILSGHAKSANIITLKFSNNSELKIVDYEYIFDMDERVYLLVNSESYESLPGKRVMVNDNGKIGSATILSATLDKKEVNHYTLYTSGSNNYIANNVVAKVATYWINDYFIIDENYKIDREQLNKDIAKYGLYTYDDVKDYISYENYETYNVKYLKFIEGKGLATREQLLNSLIQLETEASN